LRETSVDKVGANQVENGEVDTFNSSILSMGIWRNSNVLNAKLAHVVVPVLRCKFSAVVAAEGPDFGAELPFNQGDVGLDSSKGV
jgi:hypothetical protein